MLLGIFFFYFGKNHFTFRYFPTTAINFSVKDTLQRLFVKGIDPNKEKGKYFMGNLLVINFFLLIKFYLMLFILMVIILLHRFMQIVLMHGDV